MRSFLTYKHAKHAEKPGHCVYSENDLGGTVILAENMTLREARKYAKELNNTPQTAKRRAIERLIERKQLQRGIVVPS